MIRRIILPLLLLIVAATTADARTFALVCGISNYAQRNDCTDLKEATSDAKRFKELLTQQTNDITILTSKYVTQANVLEKLRAICNRAQASDRIVFFFSGHGTTGAICGYDKNITYKDIISTLETSKAKEKMIYIDACRSGSIADVTKSFSPTGSASIPGYAIFVSCRANEGSSEDTFLASGYFTQALIKGMRGKSDKNADKLITVEELFRYVHADAVKRSTDKAKLRNDMSKVMHPVLIAPKSMLNAVVFKW